MCDMWANKEWVSTPIEDALSKYDATRTKRCPECHGQVRAHKAGENGMRPHFEHYDRHTGCSLGDAFLGTPSMHPKALA